MGRLFVFPCVPGDLLQSRHGWVLGQNKEEEAERPLPSGLSVWWDPSNTLRPSPFGLTLLSGGTWGTLSGTRMEILEAGPSEF